MLLGGEVSCLFIIWSEGLAICVSRCDLYCDFDFFSNHFIYREIFQIRPCPLIETIFLQQFVSLHNLRGVAGKIYLGHKYLPFASYLSPVGTPPTSNNDYFIFVQFGFRQAQTFGCACSNRIWIYRPWLEPPGAC